MSNVTLEDAELVLIYLIDRLLMHTIFSLNFLLSFFFKIKTEYLIN